MLPIIRGAQRLVIRLITLARGAQLPVPGLAGRFITQVIWVLVPVLKLAIPLTTTGKDKVVIGYPGCSAPDNFFHVSSARITPVFLYVIIST